MFNSTGNFKAMGQYGQMYLNTTVASFADARQLQKFVNAIKEEDIKTMKKIIKKGLDVNMDLRFEAGMEKMTALHFAARKGLVLAVHEILTAKCDLNKVTPFDLSTPLHFACQIENAEASAAIVKELLSHGANPNLLDHSGRSPIYIAVQRGYADVVKVLLRYGSDAGVVCKADEYPDAIRHMSKHLDLMDSELQEMYDPYQGNSPLVQACREHFVDIVKEILKSDCDINYSNTAGNTALHVAAKSESRSTYLDRPMTRFPLTGHLEIVEMLVDKSADLNHRNLQGDTAIKRAADGIREIFLWSFTTEDKIKHAMVFCDVMSCLILSGCDLSLAYKDKSLLTILLQAKSTVHNVDAQALTNKYILCILYLLAAGISVTTAEREQIQQLQSGTPVLSQALLEATQIPWTLKKLCKLTIRKYLRFPLRKNLMLLGLPRSLKQYISLETNI